MKEVLLAFPPTQIGYPQHRRVFWFLQISRRASRVTNSPTLEVIGRSVANFIVLRKRKLKHQPSGAFLKATHGKRLQLAEPKKEPNGQIYTFQACTLRHMNELSKEPQTRSLHFKAKPRKEQNKQIFTFELGGQFLHCAI